MSLLKATMRGVALKSNSSTILLNTLSLSNYNINLHDNTPQGTLVGNINGRTNGSTVTITPTDSKFALSGNDLIIGSGTLSSGNFSVTLRETLVGAANSPRDTVILVTITAYIALSTLTLTASSFSQDASAGTIIGAVQNKTSGSTLSIFPVDNRVALSGTNLIIGSTQSSSGLFNITIRETLVGAANSPRDTTLGLTVNVPSGGLLSVAGTFAAQWGVVANTTVTATGGTTPYTLSGIPSGLSSNITGGTLKITGTPL